MDPAKIERPITLVYVRKGTQEHTVNKVNVIIKIAWMCKFPDSNAEVQYQGD
jgi:hypothetical protein